MIAASGRIQPELIAALASLPVGSGTLAIDGPDLRVFMRQLDGAPEPRLAVAMSLAGLDASLERLRTLLMAVAAGGIAVALIGGWAIASAALRPIAVVTETARAIAGSRAFSRRVPAVTRRDELGRLAATFNDMLTSLEAAHEAQQRFVSDTSHELRTPLTTVQGNAELLAQEDADPSERREAVAQILRETRRLTRLIDDLLALARADAAEEPLEATPVELDEVLMEVFAEMRSTVGDRMKVVGLDEAPVAGERDRLKQLVLILLDNAIRYAPGGQVEASVAVDDGSVVLRVDDEGVGVSPEVEARAFERFYRGDAARRLAPEGTGLGLAIARWIAERHGGTIALRARSPRGTSAVVRLPRAVTAR